MQAASEHWREEETLLLCIDKVRQTVKTLLIPASLSGNHFEHNTYILRSYMLRCSLWHKHWHYKTSHKRATSGTEQTVKHALNAPQCLNATSVSHLTTRPTALRGRETHCCHHHIFQPFCHCATIYTIPEGRGSRFLAEAMVAQSRDAC